MAARDEILPPPRRGEWRSVVREREQSFDDYVRSCANRKTPARASLRLQPLGPVDPALLELLRDYGAAFFGLEARVEAGRPLPDAAQVPQRGQHNSSMILDALADLDRGDALVTLAITGADLFSRGKQYVFGD